MSRWLLAGYGDIAARVARRAPQGQNIIAINRSGRQCLRQENLQLLRSPLRALPTVAQPGDSILWLAPPVAAGESEPELAMALAGIATPQRFVYLSTSGVYGDCGGAWVDETAPRRPQTDRARRRAAAEAMIEEFGQQRACITAIVRVPGIYGPGRLPRQRLQKGLPILAAEYSPWSNRIHAEDLAAFLVKLMSAGQGIYNISDGCPSTISAYFLAVATVLGLPAPPLVTDTATLSPELASYMRESRRLDIGKAGRELGYSPAFPDLLQALPGCIEADLQWTATAA